MPVPNLPPAASIRSPGSPASGFTLVELLIAIALLGVLLALALPGSADALASREMRAGAEALAAALSLARVEAMKRGARVEVCPAPGGAECADGASWASGWIVRPADAPAPAAAPGDVLRRQAALRHGVDVAANRPLAGYVSFTAAGHPRLRDGALQMGSFTFCRRGLTALKLVLANSGRLRIDATREVCP